MKTALYQSASFMADTLGAWEQVAYPAEFTFSSSFQLCDFGRLLNHSVPVNVFLHREFLEWCCLARFLVQTQCVSVIIIICKIGLLVIPNMA